jgi:hypothetical protein
MAHTHSVDDKRYCLEQLCTIGFCGALGAVQILLYRYDVLGLILVDAFHVWVLLSGIFLKGLAVMRGAALLFLAGRATAADAHNHCCSHDHGADHGWAPWRYAVLLLPIMLFLMGMPWPAPGGEEEPDEPGVERLGFMDLQKYAGSKESRAYWEGKLVRLKGQFSLLTDRTFNLYREKMTCCRADVYRLNVMIEAPEALPFEKLRDKWVNVTGRVKFERPRGRDDWVSLLQMRTNDDLKLTFADSRPLQ